MARAKNETLSVAVDEGEYTTIRLCAQSEGLSVSKLMAAFAMRVTGKEHDARTRLWCQAARRRNLRQRDRRVSAVMLAVDANIVRAAAKRIGEQPHAWLRAVTIMSLEEKVDANPRAHMGVVEPERRAAVQKLIDDAVAEAMRSRKGFQAEVDKAVAARQGADAQAVATVHNPYRDALTLVSKTLAAFLYNPDRAPALAAQIRKLAELDEGAALGSEAIMQAALKATRDHKGNVIPLRRAAEMVPASQPAEHVLTVGSIYVSDQYQNRASIRTFGSVEAAKEALMSCKRCVGCTDCVSCTECQNCSQCGQCTDCVGCSGCMNVRDGIGLTKVGA